jgi:DNA-binding transcriptional regulator YdaS (Cro superfamily)
LIYNCRISYMSMPTRTPLEAVEAVLQIAFGGVAARMAEHFGVSDQTVSFWRKGERDGRPVRFPAEHCPAAERLTDRRVRCEELRPDIDWAYLRLAANEEPWDGVDRRHAAR